eukprot:3755683-Amphidinium_carterae.1
MHDSTQYGITSQPLATNTVGLPSTFGDVRTMESDDQEYIYDLSEEHVEYMTHINGDTEEDDIRLRQLQDLEDDVQSIDDQNFWDKREREEREDPEGTFWRRQQLESHQTEMEMAARVGEARDRQERREERKRGRFKGSLEDLKKMRDALRDIIITGSEFKHEYLYQKQHHQEYDYLKSQSTR